MSSPNKQSPQHNHASNNKKRTIDSFASLPAAASAAAAASSKSNKRQDIGRTAPWSHVVEDERKPPAIVAGKDDGIDKTKDRLKKNYCNYVSSFSLRWVLLYDDDSNNNNSNHKRTHDDFGSINSNRRVRLKAALPDGYTLADVRQYLGYSCRT